MLRVLSTSIDRHGSDQAAIGEEPSINAAKRTSLRIARHLNIAGGRTKREITVLRYLGEASLPESEERGSGKQMAAGCANGQTD
jgi:hypothetical protein